ncbi:DUF4837 family protein [Flavobacterium sp. FlaQc-52]|jgi:hypothetical protein|uniref:DUF4837 family protein n=1 Tax=Flavobacterium cupriresistens TaxID=2893885 RepID=A0ABU4RCV3_9FLAO|nr:MULTISPECIES: DUF4837 family protein [unclassified Flavobacterium]MDX6190409.1 DUF4837 family protein [Flavobacterium sp. Fl-318]UFH43473.1 DUF4837 family protein [Flavobacterium sp. F-323]
MNKTHFLLLLLSCLFVSCFKNDKHPEPVSGKTNTISVIIDDQLWYGEVGDSVRNKFASPVLGLTQEEPLFTINQYPAKLLEGFVTDSRSIIVIKKGTIDKFEIKHNPHSLPHNTFRIYAKSVDDIICSIELNSAEMIKMIRDAEIQKIQEDNSKSLLHPTIIKNKFHIDLQIPSGYEYMLHKKNFIWLKKEIISGSTSLLIYQVPLKKLKRGSNVVEDIVKMRDSVGRYIKGRETNTQMITGEAYAPYFLVTELNGKKTFETKGTWELKNDFMTGPFINYAIIDEAYNRILVIEGFCYSPSDEERDLMLDLEAIIKSVKVDKR